MALDTSSGFVQTTKAVLTDKNTGLFLLVKEREGTWGLPGGAKETEDADLYSALVRELSEELSLGTALYTARDMNIADEFSYASAGWTERYGMRGVNNFFYVEASDVSGIKRDESLLDMTWFDAVEALENLGYASLKRGFEKVLKDIGKL